MHVTHVSLIILYWTRTNCSFGFMFRLRIVPRFAYILKITPCLRLNIVYECTLKIRSKYFNLSAVETVNLSPNKPSSMTKTSPRRITHASNLRVELLICRISNSFCPVTPNRYHMKASL